MGITPLAPQASASASSATFAHGYFRVGCRPRGRLGGEGLPHGGPPRQGPAPSRRSIAAGRGRSGYFPRVAASRRANSARSSRSAAPALVQAAMMPTSCSDSCWLRDCGASAARSAPEGRPERGTRGFVGSSSSPCRGEISRTLLGGRGRTLPSEGGAAGGGGTDSSTSSATDASIGGTTVASGRSLFGSETPGTPGTSGRRGMGAGTLPIGSRSWARPHHPREASAGVTRARARSPAGRAAERGGCP
jgi:hypothetical protein